MADPIASLETDFGGFLKACQEHDTAVVYDKVVVGAAVLRIQAKRDSSKEQVQLLLLQRSATERFYPNVYELPGGKVERQDKTIRDAVFRELKEETGLSGTAVLGGLTNFEYETTRVMRKQDGMGQSDTTEIRVTQRSIQLSYIVKVEGETNEIILNPAEHQNAGWFVREEAVVLDMTDAMRKVVNEAFD